MASARRTPAPIGAICAPEARKSGARAPHTIDDPRNDVELSRVLTWLRQDHVAGHLRKAVDDAVKYVLDGARTWRFDLNDENVDSDERASVGTKLQYHVIENLGLRKAPPLDTWIDDVPVEIKGTVRTRWMIPTEGQCEITLLVQIDTTNERFRSLAMRAHREWLSGGRGNRDKKRSPLAAAVRTYAQEVTPWAPLPPEPLRKLTLDQAARVFDKNVGLRARVVSLFTFLPETILPRGSLLVVGAGLQDPLKRIREAKPDLARQGLVLLVGKWRGDRVRAAALGHPLAEGEWISIPAQEFIRARVDLP